MSNFGKLTPLGWVKLIAAIASAIAAALAGIFPDDPQTQDLAKHAKK